MLAAIAPAHAAEPRPTGFQADEPRRIAGSLELHPDGRIVRLPAQGPLGGRPAATPALPLTTIGMPPPGAAQQRFPRAGP